MPRKKQPKRKPKKEVLEDFFRAFHSTNKDIIAVAFEEWLEKHGYRVEELSE